MPNKITPRKQLVNELVRTIYLHNYDAWRLEQGNPTDRTRKFMHRFVRPCQTYRIEPYTVNNIYGTFGNNSFEGLAIDFSVSISAEIQAYFEQLSDLAFKRLALEVLRKAERKLNDSIDVYLWQNREVS